MPLTLNLKPRERFIVNGVVIENSGSGARILIHTAAVLLREKDIIRAEEASTPARRIYFALQSHYLDPAKPQGLPPAIDQMLAAFQAAAPDAADIIGQIRELAAEGRLYQALKATRQLIAGEQARATEAAGQTSSAAAG
ncbi:MAG TPA: flagellar biosynthesis repressor FlbT [Stellaceae bacterium]|nr:flagellar biosynthesis repressor FlbT [Stellaceae bacterium]